MQPTTRARFYYPQLDGLRFIAFLLVFLHNSPIISNNWFINAIHEYGWVGVDLFFCLSGFLITKLLITEHQQTGGIDVQSFYIRRILRIWPLYFIYIAIAVIYIFLNFGLDTTLLKHVIGLTTFTYDFVYLFLTYKTFAVFFHLWTISYEEQFYAIIPWVMKKFVHIPQKTVASYLIVVFIFGSILRAVFIYMKIPHPAIYMLPFTHFEAMIGGLAIGIGLFDDLLSNTKGWVILLLGIASNAILFALPNTYEIGWSLMITYPLVGLGMTLILLSVTKKERNLFIMILRKKPLVYLGKISFGLYMFHLICLSLTDEFILHFPMVSTESSSIYYWLLVSIGFVLTTLISIVSYQWIEKPFLIIKERFSSILTHPV